MKAESDGDRWQQHWQVSSSSSKAASPDRHHPLLAPTAVEKLQDRLAVSLCSCGLSGPYTAHDIAWPFLQIVFSFVGRPYSKSPLFCVYIRAISALHERF